MAYYHNPNRLPDSPLLQNIPDLKSNLFYAKQVLSSATNTSLLDIPKREKPTTASNALASSHSGPSHLANSLGSLHGASSLGYSGKSPLGNPLGHSASAQPKLGNSATKADMNWLYNVNKGVILPTFLRFFIFIFLFLFLFLAMFSCSLSLFI
jgi:hypothetical protein